ncbi:hypothetical protein [Thermus sediminis]|uniref:hypothetical protein n=1 Tax=Thermus sediminis TaxID=1761908 RepID=UPI000E3CA29B|nr:hypothetical protein [Thermus sediminis]
MEGLFRALLNPKADPAQRRRGLRLYALALLAIQGMVLLPLAFLLPPAPHPALFLLALLGAAGLYLHARGALGGKGEGLLAPLVAVGLGAGAFLFLGVIGLLLRPWGLGLFPLGLGLFLLLLRQGEAHLGRGS